MTLAVNKTQDQTMYPTAVGGRSMGLFKQRYAETITYQIDYSNWLDDGDTISDATFAISPQTSPTVDAIGKIIRDGNQLLFQIENGKENTRYIVTVEITTSTGQVKDDYFQLNIGTPPGDAMQSGVNTALSAAQLAEVGAESARAVAQAAQAASESARNAALIARSGAELASASATTAKTGAETAATTATTKANEASLSEANALNYKNTAADKADEALLHATAAGQSATTASTKASEAATSAAAAASSASTATTKAADASTYSSSAATSAATATTKANQASASETNAAASAATATTKASESAASATSAAASASTATTKASEASTSATNASTSATSANTANTAAQSAKTAAQSAQTAAQAAQTAAQNAQVAAESARDATLSAYDSFDDRYLGAKASDPTLDNDGNALVAGTLYFNTTINQMKIYLGASWTAAYVAGEGVLMKANNLSDITSASSARTNLGLGGAAVLNVGTVASTVAAGDDSRITGAAQKSANLSDLANAATARTNLGLGTAATQDSTAFAAASHTHAISDVTNLQTALDAKQPLDADLTAIAGLAGTSGLLKKTAADTWALDTTSYLASSTIGSSVQAWDADLDAIAALAGTSGLLKKTAANAWALDTNTYLTSINNSNWSGTQLSVGNGGTGATSITGILKGNGTNAFTAAVAGTDYVAPGGALGTPSSGNLANCTFPTLNQNTTGTAANVTGVVAIANGGTGASDVATARSNLGLTALATTSPGTGVAAALAIAIGTAGALVTNGGALGTPLSGTLTNCSGLPAAGVTGLATVATSGAYSSLSGLPTLGSLAALSSINNSNWSGTQLSVANGGTGLTSLTSGYIPFGGSTTYGSDSSLFWDNTNKRLGIGTASPGTKLEVNGGSAAPIVLLNTTGATPGAVLRLLGNTSGYKNWQISASYTSLAGGLEFTPSTTNGGSTFTTPALLLSQDGNLGLGVTPSGNFLIQTPSTNSSSAANLHGFKLNYCYLGSSGGDYPYFGYNMRFQQANGSYLYDVADAATAMRFGSDIRFYVAGSGTAGSTISFTQAMTLDASSNLTVAGSITANNGGTFANANLHVSGQNITATDGSGYWAAGNSTYTCGWFGSSGAMIFRAGGSSERARIDASGNVIINAAAIATNATNGFLYVPTCAGTPTGTPTTYTGRSPIVVDTTNNRLYFYSGGAWRNAGP